MSKFALEEIDRIKGIQTFYDLMIEDKGQFETFSSNVEDQYSSELLTIYARMDLVANLNRMPKEKFKDITPKNEAVKEYEIKTKHLRVYLIHLEKTGKVIVLGGFKNRQKADIRKFRSLKKQYLNSLENDK